MLKNCILGVHQLITGVVSSREHLWTLSSRKGCIFSVYTGCDCCHVTLPQLGAVYTKCDKATIADLFVLCASANTFGVHQKENMASVYCRPTQHPV